MTRFEKALYAIYAVFSLPAWRSFLATLAGVGALGLVLLAVSSFGQNTSAVAAKTSFKNPPPAAPGATAEDKSIRPMGIRIPDAELVDLRRRIAATKWPDRELVSDATQGVQLATMQKLAHYWETDYDWRKAEARLNALPQFVSTIDGLDIHFIHVRSKHDRCSARQVHARRKSVTSAIRV